MSSPVFTITVTASGATARTSPRRNFPAPIPPASAATLIQGSVVGSRGWPRPRPRTRSGARSPAPEPARRCRPDEIESLLAARGPDLERLMSLASHLRELGHGGTVTYSRKVFVPLTMLCRDHCHYCTFAKPPAKLERPFLSPEEVVAIAEAGRRLGCKEALFTLGDRPEERYPAARDWLAERGYGSTLDYVRAAAIRVIEETGLLPHLNPGVMSYEEMARLKQVAPSMGMMLETSSDRLSRARRAALRLAGQGPRRAPARDRGRRAPGDPVHHRHPRRDRRDPGRARRVAPRDPRAPPALPPRPGGHRPELPGQARDGDARRARAGGRGVPRHRRDGAGRARTADARPGAAEPVRPRAADRASSTPGSTTGAASRR